MKSWSIEVRTSSMTERRFAGDEVSRAIEKRTGVLVLCSFLDRATDLISVAAYGRAGAARAKRR